MALKSNPIVAERMNALPKVVFSRSMEKAGWSNTRLVKSGLGEVVRGLKKEAQGIAVMGSGSIVSQMAAENLVDEYQMVLIPVVLGSGRTMFESLGKRIALKRLSSRFFANGNVLVCYEPVA